MMVYLDYASSTPVDEEVLKAYYRASLEYYNRISSSNDLGIRSNHLYSTSLGEIASLLGVNKEEIILTSGFDRNYDVLLDIINSNNSGRNRIIVSKLEDPYMYEFIRVLEKNGYVIDYVNNTEEGLIDLNDLKDLINEHTYMVFISYVNGELGIRQPIKSIKQSIKQEDSKVLLFSDLSYAFGRVNVSFKDIDIGMIISDNAYGIKGKGIVFKGKGLKITNKYSVDLPSIVALAKMVEINMTYLVEWDKKVRDLNERIINKLRGYKGLLINNNKYSIPHIISISLMNICTKNIIDSINDYEIYISNVNDNSDLSTSVMAVYGDKLRSLTSIRIGLSQLVSYKDIDYFLEVFDNIYYERGINYEKDNDSF